MTNEEKAREIYNITYEQCIKDGYPEKVDIACAIMGKMGAEIMAEWKDRQTREKWHTILNWLERNAKNYCLSYGAACYDTGMLIYELREEFEWEKKGGEK